MWVKEATCLLDSTANCTTPWQRRQLAALRSEALVWELRFADGRTLFVCTLKVSTAAQALLQGAREWPEVLLSCTKSTWGSCLFCTALTDAYGACPLHGVLQQREKHPENLLLAQTF